MPSSRQAVFAPNAPKANGKYSHAIKSSNGTLYLAGWMGDDPETGEIVPGGIEAQTERAIMNIKACLEAAGSSLDKVMTRRIYIIPMQDFRKSVAVWDRFFEEPYPVSTLIGVTALAKEGALVEFEVVAEQ
ncbi:hypothetical protein A1O1_05087 [Capronia coronata CBS 617.96]|uniref:Uncharacterized protein n=1 Tax=Capronia coronata CBS 617.96 TaxID=1182541 RepID=W9Z0V5_9EURO|nr:uncharacterized protein A1O1_05087 [Capronia coronata CBS 617.96]EXJ88159.1 hypothetical protein A1O1_05087 [Capronia coronata CBS 617.96]